MIKKLAVCMVLLVVSLTLAPKAHAVLVDLELALLVDVSGSISSSEFTLQQTGYVNAFNNSAVYNAIMASTPNGSIAATLVYWSSYNQQTQAVGWTLINSAASSQAFASAIAATTRPYNGNTGVGEALAYGGGLFASNGFEGTRLVIDISGDGTDNSGSVSSAQGRASALAAGVTTINGLVIGTSSSVFNEYQNDVIGGTNPFVVQVDDFDDFGAAIDQKIIREITGGGVIPEPASLSLLGLGLLGLARLRRKK